MIWKITWIFWINITLAKKLKGNKILTNEEKAKWFDYLASRLGEAKIITSFGGSEWIYHEKGSPENLVASLKEIQGFEANSEDENN